MCGIECGKRIVCVAGQTGAARIHVLGHLQLSKPKTWVIHFASPLIAVSQCALFFESNSVVCSNSSASFTRSKPYVKFRRPAGAVCPCVSRPTGQSIRRVPSAEYATLLRSPIVSSTSPVGNVRIQTFCNWKKFSKTFNKSISFKLFVGMKRSISNNT